MLLVVYVMLLICQRHVTHMNESHLFRGLLLKALHAPGGVESLILSS